MEQTLTLRGYDLSHETEHFLDCAVESSCLDAGSRIVLTLYGEADRIDAIFDDRRPNYYRWQHTIYPALAAYADELLVQLDDVHRIGAELLAIGTLYHQIGTTAEWYASAAIEDICEGGILEDFLPWRKDSWDVTPPKRGGRRLLSPRWIRHYVRHMPESDILRWSHDRIIARSAALRERPIDLATVETAKTIFDRDLEMAQARREAVHIAGYQKLLDSGALKMKRRERRIYRKRVKKAAVTAAALLGAPEVNQFIGGKPVELRGQAAILVVQRRFGIGRIGHGSLHLSLRDMSGYPLAALCFYIQDTPALDQLTALALAMRAGEEEELLSIANVVHATERGAEHPLLKGRIAAQEAEVIENFVETPKSRRKKRNAAYWAASRDLWVNALGRHVFGRGWKVTA